MKKIINEVVVCGSIVYDRIMDFPGKFSDHILPDKVHMLNVSFTLNKIKESFGGTGANIAFNLAMLGENPKLRGVVGEDGEKYLDWLSVHNVDISGVRTFKKEMTSSAYIMTDRSDNQITGFYPGSNDCVSCRGVKRIKNLDLAIVSPDARDRMMEYINIFIKMKVPYIFDPGQQIPSLSAKDLRIAIKGARMLIGNDYEIQMILNKLRIKLVSLLDMVETTVITQGEKGSEIYTGKKRSRVSYSISSAKPSVVVDPTGAGDAYRAGLMKGLLLGWPMYQAGRLAATVAVYAVEKSGCQAHKFTWQQVLKRYQDNFGSY
jgi:adenosine kinase